MHIHKLTLPHGLTMQRADYNWAEVFRGEQFMGFLWKLELDGGITVFAVSFTHEPTPTVARPFADAIECLLEGPGEVPHDLVESLRCDGSFEDGVPVGQLCESDC